MTALDKVILAEIDSLDNDGCTASNDYLAKMSGCTITKVSTTITKLKSLGMIEVVNFDGRQRKMKSCLKQIDKADFNKSTRQTLKNLKADFKKIKVSPYNNKIDYKIDDNIVESIGKKAKRFSPPSLEEVKAYCLERGNGIDAQHFIDYYTANGWKVGKNPMKDWKATVRTWERNGINPKKEKEHSYDLDEWEEFAMNFDPTKGAGDDG